MAIPAEEVFAEMTPKSRARAKALAAQWRLEAETLAEIRKSKGMTQKELAAELGVSQAAVSKIERDGTKMIDTLRGHVEALGGTLRLVAEFPGRPPVEVDMGDLIAQPADAIAAE